MGWLSRLPIVGLPDSGGFFGSAKYGPGNTDARRPDGQWVRVRFHRPISARRAERFGAAIAAGKPIPPDARVTVWEVRPPYQVPGVDLNAPPWCSSAPVGELPHGNRYECRVALEGGRITTGIYRESWLGEWHWYDTRGRRIEPIRFAYILDLPPRG